MLSYFTSLGVFTIQLFSAIFIGYIPIMSLYTDVMFIPESTSRMTRLLLYSLV